jgi:hypothetical protein
LEGQERPGVEANGRFYLFARHFIDNRAKGEHSEATDELITAVLSDPDYIQPPEGNRTVYWKIILETNDDNWRMLVVVAEEPGGPQVLSAYKDTRGRGASLW